MNAYQRAIERHNEGEAKISAYQKTVIAQCKQMRAQCHQEVDRQFDGLEERVKAMISPNAEQWQQTGAETQRKLQELERQKQDLEQALADIEAGLVCSDVTVEETKAALKTMKAPDFSMQLQRVQLEINTDWMKTNTVTVNAKNCDVIPSGLQFVHSQSSVNCDVIRLHLRRTIPIIIMTKTSVYDARGLCTRRFLFSKRTLVCLLCTIKS